MDAARASVTAMNTARHRAAHLVLDAEPKIFADTFAREFAGHDTDEDLLSAVIGRDSATFPRMRALFCVRSRHAEDELTRATRQGIAQYVILGAGLDSFAYRRPDLAGSLRVFEVDHPASQAWKRARVAELGIPAPQTLTHIAIDFERDTLSRGLRDGGVDAARPVFFSWLGVTQYLTVEAIRATLAEIVGFAAPGSKVVLQVVQPPETLAPEEAVLVHALADRAGRAGEPWRTYLSPAELERHLRETGFGAVEHFSAAVAEERYLRGRPDGLTLPSYFHMATAVIT